MPLRAQVNPGNSKVLVVDDDESMRRLLSAWLTKAGYLVCEARDGSEALKRIKDECPDFLITDWEMPLLNGLDLCRQVREMDLPHYVYILFLSAKTSSEEMISALEQGADEFIRKPVYQGELMARIRAGKRLLEMERRLSQMARTDSLTGMLTQRSFFDSLEKEWIRSEKLQLPISCVMIDLDFFKRINDLHGHPAGDVVLKAVSQQMTKSAGASELLCRYGGEEFCIIMPETLETDAINWAERLRESLSEMPISVGDKTLRITASFGVSQRYPDTRSVSALIDQADQALLCAKRSGRDRVVGYESLRDAADVNWENDQQTELFRGVEARHVMSPVVLCLREMETVGQAAELFLRSRLNSTPVVDENGKLLGILSEKDLMAAMVSLDAWKLPISEVMKPNVITYEESTPIRTIYDFLCRVSIRRIVVVNDNCPVGTISRATLLRWFRNMVLSRGLMSEELLQSMGVNRSDGRSQERLLETAKQLAFHASKMHNYVESEEEDVVPYIVGEATGIQELVTDLLAYSRFVHHSAFAESDDCGMD